MKPAYKPIIVQLREYRERQALENPLEVTLRMLKRVREIIQENQSTEQK